MGMREGDITFVPLSVFSGYIFSASAAAATSTSTAVATRQAKKESHLLFHRGGQKTNISGDA